METKELSKLANEVKDAYRDLNKKRGEKYWTYKEYTEAFVADVGDLMKLVMAKSGFRSIENHDELIAHELADCMWCVFVIAEELGIDIEKEFVESMKKLKDRIAAPVYVDKIDKENGE
jgi:NTP pyrophosphatase (non-canonical NTP hydrolase)